MNVKISAMIIMFCIIPVSVFAESPTGPLAIGQKANYASSWPIIEYETDVDVSVGVHDQRPYVISGEKSPTYTGVVRGGFGNPWDVNTQSDKPLSDDIAAAVASGFMRVGIQATFVPILFSDDHLAAIGKLKQLRAKKIVLITLREWQEDSYRTAGFFINAVLQIYDEEGKEIANSFTSHSNTGSGDGSVESTYNAARLHLSKLLNDPKVMVALEGSKLLQPSVHSTKDSSKDVNFIAYKNGTVLDKNTNLMWASKDNGTGISWKEAKKYCDEYRGGGYTDWRMPTQDELATLYDIQISDTNGCNITQLIALTKCSLWSLEHRAGAYFRFDGGLREWTNRPFNFYNYRVLPVRSGK